MTSLAERGFELTFRDPKEKEPLIIEDDVPQFSHVVLFAPSTKCAFGVLHLLHMFDTSSSVCTGLVSSEPCVPLVIKREHPLRAFAFPNTPHVPRSRVFINPPTSSHAPPFSLFKTQGTSHHCRSRGASSEQRPQLKLEANSFLRRTTRIQSKPTSVPHPTRATRKLRFRL